MTRTAGITMLCLLVGGCAQGRCTAFMSWLVCDRPAVEVAEDQRIAFPQFYETTPIDVGTGGTLFRIDGATAQAIRVAADDFLPSATARSPCWATPAAHRYRTLRRGDVIFVYIEEDPER